MKDLPKDEILALIKNAPATSPASRVRYRNLSIVVVMASWNEAGKIGPGVRAVPRDIVDTVCVIDNGSCDETGREAEAAGAVVIRHPVNIGAGGGYRSGYYYGLLHGFDLIVELAGDNQDVPSEIPSVVDALINGSLDYVQGSRWMKGGSQSNMTLSRIALTRFYSFLFRLFYQAAITDATNGFRAFKPSLLENKRINLWQPWLIQYELEPYLLIKTVTLGYRFSEAPVTKRYHEKMEKNTKMVPFKSWYSIIRPIFLLRFGFKT